MTGRKVLFFSGSIGLGHASRDVAIARELRHLTGADVSWLAAAPADRLIREAGERVLPESAGLADDSGIAERSAAGFRLSLVRYATRVKSGWSRNVELVDRLVEGRAFDLLIGDETYEITLAYKSEPARRKCPFVMIYDFVGVDPMSWSPLERIGTLVWNRRWAEGHRRPVPPGWLNLFVGEEEDIPDKRFGVFLPRRRAWARERCRFVGYVLPFEPGAYADGAALRARLGYPSSPLVVCAIGGTSVGKSLLELCGRAFPIAAAAVPELRMVLVCGPRVPPSSLDVPAGVDVRGYVPSLHEHLAASDLAVVQGGGTITLELTALRRPFLYFPVEGHSEQEVAVAGRLKRHGAGIGLRASATTPAALARAIVENLGRAVSYPAIPSNGASVGARLIAEFAGWSPGTHLATA